MGIQNPGFLDQVPAFSSIMRGSTASQKQKKLQGLGRASQLKSPQPEQKSRQ